MNYKKLLFIIITCYSLNVTFAYPQSIAIVVSKSSPFSEDVLSQIKETIHRSNPDIIFDTIYTENEGFINELKNKSYNLICALGPTAAQISDAMPNTPVVFSLAAENAKSALAKKLISGNSNITGVFASPEPIQQINIIKKILPKVKTVFLFHDGTSEKICEDIVNTPSEMAFNAARVENGLKIPSALNSLSPSQEDAFWMLPDPTIYNKDSIAFILNYGAEKHLPLIGFASNIVKAGALFGYVLNYKDIGEQTAQIIIKIINGTPAKDIPPQRARKVGYAINLKIAEYLKVKITPDIINQADEVIK